MLTTFTTYQHDTGKSSHEKERKGIQIWKEGVRLCLFADDVILYRNPKITHMNHKKLKLINELSKIA
jgi:hypothetical protein